MTLGCIIFATVADRMWRRRPALGPEVRPIDWKDRITADPKVLVGKPVIRGTRIAVEFLIELLAEGWTTEDIVRTYPQLTADDVRAALSHAADPAQFGCAYPPSA